jgi:hypothetical protein
MSKNIIESALRVAIIDNLLHLNTLLHGKTRQRENSFTNNMAPLIPHCWAQVPRNNELIDLVKINVASKCRITNELLGEVDWALEAKHYDPHQNAGLNTFLNYSLSGPIKDLLKLSDCGFSTIYILQLQTEVVDFAINQDYSYAQFIQEFPFMGYLSKTEELEARANITRIGAPPNYRMDALVAESRIKLDANLKYGNMVDTIIRPIGNVIIKIHYLISGPFNSEEIRNRLYADGYNNNQPLEDQYKARPNINVSIESDLDA